MKEPESRGCRAAVLVAGVLLGCSPERESTPDRAVRLGVTVGPQVGPELSVSQPRQVSDAVSWTPSSPKTYEKPAWNGSAYLVLVRSLAWRLDANGKELSPGAFRVPVGARRAASGTWVEDKASAASNGTDWLLAWGEQGSVRAARVSSAGALIDPAGFPVAAVASAGSVEVAWDGTNYFVVWGDGDIYGARITPTGNVLDATPITIAARAGEQTEVDVAWAGTHHLVVWRESAGAGDIAAARVAKSGAVLDPNGIALSSDPASENAPDVASSGNESLVVWRFGSRLRAGRVSASGVALDQPTFDPAADSLEPHRPSVTWDGADYVAGYSEYCGAEYGTAVRRISANAVVGPEAADRCCYIGNYVVVGSNGTGQHLRLRSCRLYYAYLASAQAGASNLGKLGVEWFPTTRQPHDQPRIATGGNTALVLWREPFLGTRASFYDDGNSAHLGAAHLTPLGTTLDPDGLLFQRGKSTTLHSLELAAGPNGFLATLVDSKNAVLNGVPIAASGPFGTHGPDYSAYGARAKVLSDGAHYLVAWEPPDGPAGPAGPRAARFDATGTSIDPTPVALPSAITGGVWNGTSYFVVWADAGIKAARLRSTGTLIDGPLTLGTGECPQVAWDGTNHLVVWSNAGTVQAARVDARNAILDPGGFALGTGGCPRVAYNGAHHVVVWSEGTPASVRARRVTSSGALVDPSPFTIQSPGDEPDIASVGDGRALVVYTHRDPDEPYEPKYDGEIKPNRVWVRQVSDVCGCDGGSCDGAVCVGATPDAGSDAEAGTIDDGGIAGAAGSSGASGTSAGGTAGAGSGATGGTSGRDAGSTAGRPGTGGASGASQGGAPPASDDGCGCRIGGNADLGASTWALTWLIALVTRRRRRQRDE